MMKFPMYQLGCISKRSIAALLFLVVVQGVSTPVWAEAGLSEVLGKTQRWVIKPYAIESSRGKPAEGYLFIGDKAPWYVPGHIMHTGWVGWDVDGVKEYGTIDDWIIYGTTTEGRWFVIDLWHGIPLRFFTDRQVWIKKLVKLGAPSDPPLAFEVA